MSEGNDAGEPGLARGFLNAQAVLQARLAAQRHGLHPSLRHVLEVVAGFTNGCPAWPSYQTLASITGLSASRVRQYTYKLVEQGYLAMTRQPAGKGGWGQPRWALGPLCRVSTGGRSQVSTGGRSQVSTGDHLPEQVSTGGRSSVHGRTLQVSTGGHRKEKEEKTRKNPLPPPLPTAPSEPPATPVVRGATAPPPRGHPRVQAMIEALRTVGLPDRLTPQERNAVLASDLPVAEIAGCMAAIRDQQLGDQWDRDHLTVNQGVKLHRSWKTRPRLNGHILGTVDAFLDSFGPKEAPDDPRGLHRALPAPGVALPPARRQ